MFSLTPDPGVKGSLSFIAKPGKELCVDGFSYLTDSLRDHEPPVSLKTYTQTWTLVTTSEKGSRRTGLWV